jgi:acyl carrier protein
MLPGHAIESRFTGASFKRDLLRFINEVLPRTRGKSREREPVEVVESTPLFDSGLVDSLAIVQLIAFVERTTGREIPARMVVMKHFRTVLAICESFGPGEIGECPPPAGPRGIEGSCQTSEPAEIGA